MSPRYSGGRFLGVRFLDRREEGYKKGQSEKVKGTSSAGLVTNKRYNGKDSALFLSSEQSGFI